MLFKVGKYAIVYMIFSHHFLLIINIPSTKRKHFLCIENNSVVKYSFLNINISLSTLYTYYSNVNNLCKFSDRAPLLISSVTYICPHVGTTFRCLNTFETLSLYTSYFITLIDTMSIHVKILLVL